MVSILDDFPYPWDKSEAQQLHTNLTQIHPSGREAMFVAQKSGLNTGMILFEQPPAYVWKDTLDEAARSGLTRTLVKEVRDRLGPNSPMRPFLDGLLADRPVRTDGEPRGTYGAPSFITNNDDISEPEALLYYDDLTIQVGKVPGLISTLQKLAALAPAVCRLVVDIHGQGQHGTGFRIGPDILLTNWHVLHDKHNGTRATAVTAEFGYEDDGSGGALAPVVVPCDASSIVADQADDWAVIRSTQALADAWPEVKLSEAATPTQSTSAYIIQHPGGQRKRVGFVRNQVSFFDERVVHYLTDTQEGSSGSPVFDAQGRLIALHHAGGRPQEVVGRSPVKKNEGIRISRIVKGLTSRGVNVP
jgi:V8-like Glu-specific endopeptidase